MKLSVLVPVYNEERTLEEVVGRVCAFPIAKEIILVDDGSKDRSREILTRLRRSISGLTIRSTRSEFSFSPTIKARARR